MRIYLNKDTSQTRSGGASAPEIKEKEYQRAYREKKGWKKAVLTVEASLGVPLFLFAALCLIWILEIQSIKICISGAAQNAAKSAAEDTAVIPVLNTVKLKSDIVSLIGTERIERSILDGGSSGISCWKSYVSPITGDMHINVEYKVRLPISVFGNISARLKEEFIIGSWNGYKGYDSDEEDSQIVYITDNSAVYHEDCHCSYLQLSIRFVPSDELKEIRNAGGGIYYACEKCVFGEAMAGVYITEDGRRYHNSLSCSGLKRTIRAVNRSDVAGIGGCSRCSK